MIKDSLIFLEHILESINLIQKYLHDVDEEMFHQSTDKQDLAVRRIEIIGEAVKNIPDEFKSRYPEVPWKNMAGMRDVMIHQYFGIDYNIVWDTVTTKLPPLKDQIKEIIDQYEFVK